MTKKLKPCPFCGGEADCISEDAGWDSRGENIWAVTVGCLSCGANIEVERRCDHLMRDDDIEGETCHALEEEVAAMWNARAIDRDELLEVAESPEEPWPVDKRHLDYSRTAQAHYESAGKGSQDGEA